MAGTYGVVNLVSSFGFAAFWRMRCVHQLEIERGMAVVDLMTGMGELIPSISRRIGSSGNIRGIDLSPVMCQKARDFISHRKISGQILEDDALNHSMENGIADIVVSSFGLKTFSEAQRDVLAKNVYAILKPGGRFSLVEISAPPSRLIRVPYMFYLKFVIPLIGRIFLGNPENYRMLAVYTEAFKDCKQFANALNRIVRNGRHRAQANSVIAEHNVGPKPPTVRFELVAVLAGARSTLPLGADSADVCIKDHRHVQDRKAWNGSFARASDRGESGRINWRYDTRGFRE